MSAKCSACGAPIIWAKHEKSGKPNPIDADPCPDGNVLLRGDFYMLVPKAERVDWPKLHKSHFSTCPEAQRFRGSR